MEISPVEIEERERCPLYNKLYGGYGIRHYIHSSFIDGLFTWYMAGCPKESTVARYQFDESFSKSPFSSTVNMPYILKKMKFISKVYDWWIDRYYAKPAKEHHSMVSLGMKLPHNSISISFRCVEVTASNGSKKCEIPWTSDIPINSAYVQRSIMVLTMASSLDQTYEGLTLVQNKSTVTTSEKYINQPYLINRILNAIETSEEPFPNPGFWCSLCPVKDNCISIVRKQ